MLPLPVIAGLPAGGAESAFINFMSYKTRVPVRGAIILNPTMDKLLLVKGYKKGASWSYPRGKINKDEDDMVCAIREVFEETGFDCEGLAKEEDYVEIVMRDQNLRLYIIPGVSEDTVFECQTRKEISVRIVCVCWWGGGVLTAVGRISNGIALPISPRIPRRRMGRRRTRCGLGNTTWWLRSSRTCGNGSLQRARSGYKSSISRALRRQQTG